jgi:hypothetical protein
MSLVITSVTWVECSLVYSAASEALLLKSRKARNAAGRSRRYRRDVPNPLAHDADQGVLIQNWHGADALGREDIRDSANGAVGLHGNDMYCWIAGWPDYDRVSTCVNLGLRKASAALYGNLSGKPPSNG